MSIKEIGDVIREKGRNIKKNKGGKYI